MTLGIDDPMPWDICTFGENMQRIAYLSSFPGKSCEDGYLAITSDLSLRNTADHCVDFTEVARSQHSASPHFGLNDRLAH